MAEIDGNQLEPPKNQPASFSTFQKYHNLFTIFQPWNSWNAPEITIFSEEIALVSPPQPSSARSAAVTGHGPASAGRGWWPALAPGPAVGKSKAGEIWMKRGKHPNVSSKIMENIGMCLGQILFFWWEIGVKHPFWMGTLDRHPLILGIIWVKHGQTYICMEKSWKSPQLHHYVNGRKTYLWYGPIPFLAKASHQTHKKCCLTPLLVAISYLVSDNLHKRSIFSWAWYCSKPSPRVSNMWFDLNV